MIRRALRFARSLARLNVLVVVFALLAAATLAAQNQSSPRNTLTPAQVQQEFERADRQYVEAKYREAYQGYDRVLAVPNTNFVVMARKGKIRSALRLAQFTVAQREAELLRDGSPDDVEAVTLHADSLWGEGLFDESEQAYQTALARFPESPRARFGVARSLATRGRSEDALSEARVASAGAPEDVEILWLIGDMLERLYRYDEAVRVYQTALELMPKRLRDQSNLGATKIKVLDSFAGKVPIAIEGDPTALHVVPFRLDSNKILIDGFINGGRIQFVLDTGAERTTISRAAAERLGVRTITETMITGVGSPGVTKQGVGRVDSLQIGSLRIRNFPVSMRGESMRGMPAWQSEMLSPMSLGLSVVVDYGRKEVTFGRQIPDGPADFRMPLRVYRLPMVRGMLNTSHPAYFVVDTGGELMSISTDVATRLKMTPTRRIRLRVFGVRGLDPDAFLLPGVNLDFNDMAYRNKGVAVLNLRAPSVLLGFQVGGILGHSFLAPYRVAMDIARGELRLQRF